MSLVTRYHFTYNGETRYLTPSEIRKWANLKMTNQPIRDNLNFILENANNPKYNMLEATPHGLQVASGYRFAIGKSISKQAARSGHYGRL